MPRWKSYTTRMRSNAMKKRLLKSLIPPPVPDSADEIEALTSGISVEVDHSINKETQTEYGVGPPPCSMSVKSALITLLDERQSARNVNSIVDLLNWLETCGTIIITEDDLDLIKTKIYRFFSESRQDPHRYARLPTEKNDVEKPNIRPTRLNSNRNNSVDTGVVKNGTFRRKTPVDSEGGHDNSPSTSFEKEKGSGGWCSWGSSDSLDKNSSLFSLYPDSPEIKVEVEDSEVKVSEIRPILDPNADESAEHSQENYDVSKSPPPSTNSVGLQIRGPTTRNTSVDKSGTTSTDPVHEMYLEDFPQKLTEKGPPSPSQQSFENPRLPPPDPTVILPKSLPYVRKILKARPKQKIVRLYKVVPIQNKKLVMKDEESQPKSPISVKKQPSPKVYRITRPLLRSRRLPEIPEPDIPDDIEKESEGLNNYDGTDDITAADTVDEITYTIPLEEMCLEDMPQELAKSIPMPQGIENPRLPPPDPTVILPKPIPNSYYRKRLDRLLNGKPKPRIVPQFKCDKCGRILMRKVSLDLHMASHLNLQDYLCQTCGKTFNTMHLLRRHTKIHGGEKKHLCDKCPMAFMYPQQLVSHQRRHTGEKTAMCPVCNKLLRDKMSLRNHSVIHSEERPWKCTFCPKTFRRPEHCRAHTRIHTGVHPYKCEPCGKSWVQIGSLIFHNRTHHGIVKEKDN